MWLCTKYGFFSVVCARRTPHPRSKLDPSKLMIRARSRTHLEALIKSSPFLREAKIIVSANTDYPVRIIVPKTLWASVIAGLVDEIDYGNFKNTASKLGDREYCDFLGKTWSNSLPLQDLPGAYYIPNVDG